MSADWIKLDGRAERRPEIGVILVAKSDEAHVRIAATGAVKFVRRASSIDSAMKIADEIYERCKMIGLL